MLYLAFVCTCGYWPELNVSQIQAGYRNNALQASTLRVRWRETTRPMPGQLAYDAAILKLADEAPNNPQLSDRTKQSLAHQREYLKRRVDDPEAWIRTIENDYWTDRANFQIRVPWNRGKYAHRAIAFDNKTPQVKNYPDAETNRETLRWQFDMVDVKTFGKATGNTLRRWTGNRLPGNFFEVEIGTPAHVDWSFPPLSLAAVNWPGVRHPLDGFATESSTNVRLVGKTQIDQRDVILLEVCHAEKGRDFFERTRVFVDPDCGFIPRRIETYLSQQPMQPTQSSEVSISDGSRTLFPARVLHNVKIEEPSPGFYYPTSGMIDQFGPGPRQPDTKVPNLVVFERTQWHVSEVTVNPPMSRENFEMKFSHNVEVRDLRANTVFKQGDPDHPAWPIILDLNTKPTRSPKWLPFAAGFSAIGFLVVAIFCLIRHRRQQSTPDTIAAEFEK